MNKAYHIIFIGAGIYILLVYVLPKVFPKLAEKEDKATTSLFLAGVL